MGCHPRYANDFHVCLRANPEADGQLSRVDKCSRGGILLLAGHIYHGRKGFHHSTPIFLLSSRSKWAITELTQPNKTPRDNRPCHVSPFRKLLSRCTPNPRFVALAPPAVTLGSDSAVLPHEPRQNDPPTHGQGTEEPAGGGDDAERVTGKARNRQNLDAGNARPKCVCTGGQCMRPLPNKGVPRQCHRFSLLSFLACSFLFHSLAIHRMLPSHFLSSAPRSRAIPLSR